LTGQIYISGLKNIRHIQTLGLEDLDWREPEQEKLIVRAKKPGF
jgi:hypothetical protein